MAKFSTQNPHLRLQWSAHSLGQFMNCPLSYYWAQRWGSPGKQAPLLWGNAWDYTMAHYWGHGADLREGLRAANRYALDNRLDAIAAGERDNIRTHMSLLRSVVWYDQEYQDQTLYEPDPGLVQDASQVELIVPLTAPDRGEQLVAYTGEPYSIYLRLDHVMRRTYDRNLLVVDWKSTTRGLNQLYWLDLDPGVQVQTYDLFASQWAKQRGERLHGVLLDAVQIGVGYSRFDRHEVHRTPAHRAHWHRVVVQYILHAEARAKLGDWELWANPATQKWETVYRKAMRRAPVLWDSVLRAEGRIREEQA